MEAASIAQDDLDWGAVLLAGVAQGTIVVDR
jgi:hypothetical protein